MFSHKKNHNYTNRSIHLLIFLVIPCFFAISQTNDNSDQKLISLPLITSFSPSEYNGGIQNWDIDQDTSGYMYVANNYGLLEFDGSSWNNYPIAGATKTRSVLIERSSNKIYVGGQKQLGLFERTESGITYKNLVPLIPDSIIKDEIWDIIEFNQSIYANIYGVISKVNENSIQPLIGVTSAEFLTEVDSSLFAGSINGLFKLEGDTFKYLNNSVGYNFRGVSVYKDRFLLFTYEGEILSYTNERITSVKTQFDAFLSESKINKVLMLKNGNIVLGTQNNGLLIINEDLQPILHLTKNKGLNHRTVIALYEDNFNNLWVGLNNGICVVELSSPFSLINENVGLEGTGYAAASLNEDIYLGTSSGLFEPRGNITEMKETNRYELIKGSEGLVNNVEVIENAILLSHHEGAFILNNREINQFYNETGVWGFSKLTDTQLLGGTYEGFTIFDKKGTIPALKGNLHGLGESSRVFEFDNDSTLWMTHGYKGAYKIKLQADSIYSMEHYGAEDGFPSDLLISVYRIDDELIFTAETGIYSYNPESDRFEPHPFLNKWFEKRHVSKIKQINKNQIFYIAGGQLGLLKKESIGVYKSEEQQFRKINEYISDDLENISVINKDILVGAKEGFIRYNPELDRSIKDSFETYLKRVEITNQENETNTVTGTFFQSTTMDSPKVIRFEYSTPYFDGLSNIKFAYRLVPYEKEWSEWTETNWKEYTNLPAGEYQFEIKSLNIYENESRVGVYPFTINPQWYESNIAYTLYFAFIVFAFFSVLYSREKKHKTEKQILSQTKEEEIRSKDREIHEFSEKTNQQIQELKNERLKQEITHKNSQLASVTMHLLSKNEFVMSLRKKLNEALSNKDNTDSLNRIVKSIDKNIDDDETWDTFAQYFDQVHGNFLQKIKQEVHLTPQETKLCAYLKMNMSTKDIANLMNITIRGVELARYRLRKKLGITRETNLVEYLDDF
ncbi:Y_Y_Y domain-containing protein [Ekhidna lutea]|uniref:Y_Y_Y domain-containing protein n=1 Tax=Ekhidna lutea TaxID=447679 RepID=A0A239LWH3_EKHLU|nr:Y_Y_Y domain-containing protein [Ekhidna lutea]